ncbi:MAG: hypothetical protein CMJ31_02120, partial [Phycisphaerae bacterium]|nr:hypothetical protein [Phycisphaerae bacterium]
MNICVIIPAAGSSRRYNQAGDPLGGDRSKLDEDLGGRPVLQRTVELFTTRDEVGSIVVAGPHDDEAFAAFEMRHGDRLRMLGVTICRGGADARWQSVKAALAHVPDDATHVAVHDAARPVTPPEVIDRVFAAAAHHDALIPVVDVSDTLKRVSAEELEQDADPFAAILGGDGSGHASGGRRVETTIDRERVVSVQTPQVFEREALTRAYAQDDLSSTDDAGLMERLGVSVIAVDGDPVNLKLTRREDLPLVRAIGGGAVAEEGGANQGV